MANRYKSILEGQKDEVWYQIKCEKCEFIDCTQNKETWECCECREKRNLKVNKVITAPIKIPESIKKALVTKVITPERMKEIEKEEQMQATQQALNETKVIQHAAEKQVEESEFMGAFHSVLGTKPAEPAVVKSEFKVGGLQCKIVSTRKN